MITLIFVLRYYFQQCIFGRDASGRFKNILTNRRQNIKTFYGILKYFRDMLIIFIAFYIFDLEMRLKFDFFFFTFYIFDFRVCLVFGNVRYFLAQT